MKTTKLIGMLAVLAMTSVATAAEEGFKISGDFAFSYFGETGKGANAVTWVAPTPGGDEMNDTFAVDMTEIRLSKALGNSDIVIGIGYGRVFDKIAANAGGSMIDSSTGAPKSTLNLTDAYFHHKIGDTGLHFKVGKFQTGIGYETYNFMDNMNYTRAMGFSRQPLFMTGANLAYGQEMFDVGVSMYNSFNNTDSDENANKMFQVSGAVRPVEGLNIAAHYLTGKTGTGAAAIADYNLMNANVSYKWNMMNFALDYTMTETELVNAAPGKNETSDIALYAGYGADNWGAGLRYEMSTNEPAVGVDADTDAVTLTGRYDIDQNARVIAEVGQFMGEDAAFVDDEGKADDGTMFYGLGVMYRF